MIRTRRLAKTAFVAALYLAASGASAAELVGDDEAPAADRSPSQMWKLPGCVCSVVRVGGDTGIEELLDETRALESTEVWSSYALGGAKRVGYHAPQALPLGPDPERAQLVSALPGMFDMTLPADHTSAWILDVEQVAVLRPTELLFVRPDRFDGEALRRAERQSQRVSLELASILGGGAREGREIEGLVARFAISIEYQATGRRSPPQGVGMPSWFRGRARWSGVNGRTGWSRSVGGLSGDKVGRVVGQLPTAAWLRGRMPAAAESDMQARVATLALGCRVWVSAGTAEPQWAIPVLDASGFPRRTSPESALRRTDSVTVPVLRAALDGDGALAFTPADDLRWPVPMPIGMDDGARLPRWRPQEALVVTQELLRDCGGVVAVWLLPDRPVEEPTYVFSSVAVLAAVRAATDGEVELAAVVAESGERGLGGVAKLLLE